MKSYKSLLTLAILTVSILFAACSSSGDWDAYKSTGEQYTFDQEKLYYNFKAADEVSEVIVVLTRNTTSGEATLPVTATFSSDILSGPGNVTFADGSNTAEYVISVVNSSVVIGVSYTAKITLDEEDVSVSGNASVGVTILKDYTWVPAGTAEMYSDWAGNEEGVDIAIERAEEYAGNLYRLNSPFYHLEKDYCPDEGYHIQFYLDEDYNALSLPRIQNIGEEATAGGYWNLYWDAEEPYCSFTNEGNVFTIEGVWATGDANLGYTLTYDALEEFIWKEGYPKD